MPRTSGGDTTEYEYPGRLSPTRRSSLRSAVHSLAGAVFTAAFAIAAMSACSPIDSQSTSTAQPTHSAHGSAVISAEQASGALARAGALANKTLHQKDTHDDAPGDTSGEESAPAADASAESSEDSSANSTAPESKDESPSPAFTCAPYTGQQAAFKWGDKLRTPDDNFRWDLNIEEPRTYDPCAPLSYLVVSPEGYRNGQVHQIMLFHYGEYLGTTAWLAYDTQVEITQVNPGKITVTYLWGSNCVGDGCDAKQAVSTFTWDEVLEKVVHGGQFPPESLGV